MRVLVATMCMLWLAAMAAPTLQAQQLAPRAPERPDSILTAGPLDSAFQAWRSEVRTHGRFGASFLLRGQRYQVLVLSPMALDVLAADSLVVRQARGCQAALQFSDAAIDTLASARPWSAFDSATSARPTVAFTILPADPVGMTCGRGQMPRFAAITRGAVFGVPVRYNPLYDASTAELRRDGELMPVLLTGSAPVRKYAIGRIVEDETRQVRLYVPVEAFAPYADGRAADLSLFVSSPTDEAPDILRVPPELVRAVWAQFQPWRARQLGADGRAPQEPLQLAFATPRDTVLQRAMQAYREGQWGLATSTVLGRLAQRPLPRRRDVRDGMIMTAATFAAFGNDEDATSLLRDVLEYYPCLHMAPEAPSEMARIIERARPPARCTAKSPFLVLAAGAVPGGAQLITPRRRAYGQAVLLSTIGGFATAQGLYAYSRRAYADYQRNTGNTNTPAAADYRRAELSRNIGNAVTIGAVSVWAFAALEGAFAEWRHARRIAEVQNFGANPRLRMSIAPVTGGTGVTGATGVGLRVEVR